MKNVVFIPNINLGNGRSDSYSYSINSWKAWCDKNNCELLVWEDLLYPVDYMKITWQRYYLFDILEANKVDYKQILMVDADTIVHPNCPNFFDETDDKYCGVRVDGCYEWVLRSIRGFGDELFDGMRIHPWNYINGGFQIVNENHRSFFDAMKSYYDENSNEITKTIDKLRCGTDQTIVNYMLDKEKIDEIFKQITEKKTINIEVDVHNQFIYLEEKQFPFELDDFKKKFLLDGIDEVGFTLQHQNKIEDFEKNYKKTVPWLFK